MEACCVIRGNTKINAGPCEDSAGEIIVFKTLIDDLWEDEDSENAPVLESRYEENCDFDESDAADLRYFFATQKERKSIGSPNENSADRIDMVKLCKEFPVFEGNWSTHSLEKKTYNNGKVESGKDCIEVENFEAGSLSESVLGPLQSCSGITEPECCVAKDSEAEGLDSKNAPEADLDFPRTSYATCTKQEQEPHAKEVERSQENLTENISIERRFNISFSDIPLISAEEVSKMEIIEDQAKVNSFFEDLSSAINLNDKENVCDNVIEMTNRSHGSDDREAVEFTEDSARCSEENRRINPDEATAVQHKDEVYFPANSERDGEFLLNDSELGVIEMNENVDQMSEVSGCNEKSLVSNQATVLRGKEKMYLSPNREDVGEDCRQFEHEESVMEMIEHLDETQSICGSDDGDRDNFFNSNESNGLEAALCQDDVVLSGCSAGDTVDKGNSSATQNDGTLTATVNIFIYIIFMKRFENMKNR